MFGASDAPAAPQAPAFAATTFDAEPANATSVPALPEGFGSQLDASPKPALFGFALTGVLALLAFFAFRSRPVEA